MNLATHYRCDDCHATFPLKNPALLCEACGGLLEIEYDLGPAKPQDILDSAASRRHLGLWRWSDLLPLPEHAEPLHLGEGDTPLMRTRRLGRHIGLPGLLVKNDTLMPTGSFKDRGFSVAVGFARALGVTQAFTYSSGNAGASFAAYAARAGIEATVLVEDVANESKIAAISLSGARVLRLRYRSSLEIFAGVSALSEAGFYCFVNFINPVRHEGMKTYAYEICEALGWRAPDVMVHPVGTGGGLYGAWKGFRELKRLGLIDRLPKMVGVQPAASAPLVRAFAEGKTVAGRHGDANKTVAQSIAGDAPIQGGSRVLRAVYDSGGRVVAVDDNDLFEAMRLLGEEGISAEPSAAASTAALLRARAQGWVSESDTVVSVVTGGALKQPSALAQAARPPQGTVQADPAELLRIFRGGTE
ncbi:threonine synthase [Nonomuraea sp. B1E8]|uniref:threonine synthase n=1 Tax=unclassified Nonomuraea TaxID=2593643 RepID=UPI00325DA26C